MKEFRGKRVSNDWTIYHLKINHSQPYQVYITTFIDEDAIIDLKSFKFSPNCATGQPLTLDLYPGKIEPWEPSTIVPTTLVPVITTPKVTTIIPVTNPPSTTPRPIPTETPITTTIKPDPMTKKPEPVTKRPEVTCNCNDNLIPDECREICQKLVPPSPQVTSEKYSSSSIICKFKNVNQIKFKLLSNNYDMINYFSLSFLLDDRYFFWNNWFYCTNCCRN